MSEKGRGEDERKMQIRCCIFGTGGFVAVYAGWMGLFEKSTVYVLDKAFSMFFLENRNDKANLNVENICCFFQHLLVQHTPIVAGATRGFRATCCCQLVLSGAWSIV